MAEEEPPPPPLEAQGTAAARRGRAPASFKGTFTSRNRDENSSDKPRFKAGGARLFVGNLESERVSKEEFKNIFAQYGEVVEVSMHRSYGFVQFTNDENAMEAMKSEQGRMIGSRAIDIQRAKVNDRRNGRMTGKRRRENHYGRDRDHQRGGRDNRRRINGFGKPLLPPKNGAVMKIILLGEMQRNFAQRVADKISENRVPVELEMLDGRTLSQALRDAEANRSRYVCIVGRENINKGTTTIKLLHLKEDRGRCPTYDLPTEDLVDLVISEERKLGFEAGTPAPPAYGIVQGNPLVGLNTMPPANGLLPQQQVQPNALLQMQQQLAALSQQVSSIAQPVQSHTLQAPPQHQHHQPNAAADMQNKIMEELSRLQQQAAKIQQIQNQPAPSQASSGYMNPNIQAYSAPPPANSGSDASPAQLANLSKLLSSIQKLKGEERR